MEVSEKIETILRIIAERGRALFSELFEGVTSRSEIVVTFLALLELIRLRQLACTQTAEFGEIELRRATGVAPVVADLQVGPTGPTCVVSASPSPALAVSPAGVSTDADHRKS